MFPKYVAKLVQFGLQNLMVQRPGWLVEFNGTRATDWPKRTKHKIKKKTKIKSASQV